jgi:anaphase-promoting complex subunit 3
LEYAAHATIHRIVLTLDRVDKHSETSRRHIPDAAAVNYLLGKLWVTYGDTAKAVEFFVEALKLNPFLWEAFSELCNTGKFYS